MSFFKMKLKKGDKVIVLSGSDKGRTGVIVKTHPKSNKVTVEGVNIVKKSLKPSQTHPQGGIVEITKPLWASKVSIVEPSKNKPSKIGYKTDSKGKMTRIYKSSGKEIK